MLPYTIRGAGAPALVFMPFLGGTQAEWTEVVASLESTYTCVTIDLPGFGSAAAIAGYNVRAMADLLIDTLQHLHDQKQIVSYVLVGHSMSGKISAVATRTLLDRSNDVAPPEGLILVSPSPPGPEPMQDEKREKMLRMFHNGTLEQNLVAARSYIEDNISSPLPEEKLERTVAGVLEMDAAAWTAWLESGSKEDLSRFVGDMGLPALLVSGTHDSALGPAAQRKTTLLHFPLAQMLELDCSHLAPLELPEKLASEIQRFVISIAR